jgi:hypothetical protein
MLALPLSLLALAAAAFAIAPSSISARASARPDQRLLPPTPRASTPGQATAGVYLTRTGVSSGEHPRSRPRRAGRR